MKNNKGFTLIELLAVIAILAIILLIAVPMVLSTIDKSKNGTLIQSAKVLWKTAETCIDMNSLNGDVAGIGCTLPEVHATAAFSGFKNTGTTGFAGGTDVTNWVTLSTANTSQRFLVKFNAGEATIHSVSVHEATSAGSITAAGKVCTITSPSDTGTCVTN